MGHGIGRVSYMHTKLERPPLMGVLTGLILHVLLGSSEASTEDIVLLVLVFVFLFAGMATVIHLRCNKRTQPPVVNAPAAS